MDAHQLAAPLAGIAAAILTVAAVVHMYWALGGSVGALALVPETGGRSLPRPKASSMLLASLTFVLATDLMLVRAGLIVSRIPPWGMRVVCLTLAAAFLARAVGDFRHVGFFKRVKGSRFARLDTALYSPLCLYLGLAIGANAW